MGQTTETLPFWVTEGSQLQKPLSTCNQFGNDFTTALTIPNSVSHIVKVLPLQFLGWEGFLLDPWSTYFFPWRICSFHSCPWANSSGDYHYQTILRAAIKLHYTYLPVHLLDSWNTRIAMYFSLYWRAQHNATVVTSKIVVEHINIWRVSTSWINTLTLMSENKTKL